jgi:rRNA maturation protein Rpf1
MRLNFGHAGPEYIQYLFELGEVELKHRLDRWTAKFHKDFGHDTSYRFYDEFVSVTFAGGEIAIEKGIIDWDLERIYQVLLTHLKDMTEGATKLNNVDYESHLGDFQLQNINGVLVVRNGLIVTEPKTSLVARMDEDAQLYYVSTKALDEYLRKLQLDPRAFVEHMKDKGILINKVKKRLTDNWGGRSNTSAIHLYVFKQKNETISKNES